MNFVKTNYDEDGVTIFVARIEKSSLCYMCSFAISFVLIYMIRDIKIYLLYFMRNFINQYPIVIEAISVQYTK